MRSNSLEELNLVAVIYDSFVLHKPLPTRKVQQCFSVRWSGGRVTGRELINPKSSISNHLSTAFEDQTSESCEKIEFLILRISKIERPSSWLFSYAGDIFFSKHNFFISKNCNAFISKCNSGFQKNGFHFAKFKQVFLNLVV